MQPHSLKLLKPALLAAAFSSFQALRLHGLFSPAFSGLGVIFMMHRVLPEDTHQDFAPHKYLSITPEFLGQAIDQVRALDMDIVSLDEAYKRIKTADPRKFAVFTFDDGFRDVLRYAFPIFKKKTAPFTVYIPSSWPSGGGFLYWSLIEKIVAENTVVKNPVPDFPSQLVTKTPEQKQQAFDILATYFENQKDPAQDPYLKTLLQSYDIDPAAFCLQEIMDWDEICTLNEDELVTIGAHSVNHNDFHKLTDTELALELQQSKSYIEQQLGQPCHHFAYPFGDTNCIQKRELAAASEAGYLTAVTTRKGVVQPEHRDHMTALPRIHFHSDYQSRGYVSMVTSGFPFFVLNKFRRHVAG